MRDVKLLRGCGRRVLSSSDADAGAGRSTTEIQTTGGVGGGVRGISRWGRRNKRCVGGDENEKGESKERTAEGRGCWRVRCPRVRERQGVLEERVCGCCVALRCLCVRFYVQAYKGEGGSEGDGGGRCGSRGLA